MGFVQNSELEDVQLAKNMISATDNHSNLGANASQLPENDKKEVEIQQQAIFSQQTAEGHYLIPNNIHMNEEGQKQLQTAEVANSHVANSGKPDDDDNLDYVEGFQIFSDNMPVDVSKLPTGPDAMQVRFSLSIF